MTYFFFFDDLFIKNVLFEPQITQSYSFGFIQRERERDRDEKRAKKKLRLILVITQIFGRARILNVEYIRIL